MKFVWKNKKGYILDIIMNIQQLYNNEEIGFRNFNNETQFAALLFSNNL